MADAMTLTAPAQQLESSNQQQSESVSPNASLYETSSNETGQISAANTSGVNMNSTLDSLVDNLEGLSPASNGSGGSLGRGGTNGLSGDTTGQFGAMVGGRAGDGDSYGKMGENDSFFSGDATYNSLLNTLCAANWSQAPPARSGPTFQQSMSVPCGQQGGNAGANPAHFNLNDSGIDIGNLSLQIGLLNLTQAADSALFSGGAQPQKGSPRNESVHQSRGGGHSGWPNFSGNANASELLVNASAANWGSGPQSNANAALMNMSRQTSGVSSLATPFNTSSSAQNSPSGELLKNRSSRDMASAQAPDGAYAPLESQLLELIRAQQGAGAAGPNLFASLPGASFGGGAQNGAPAALGRSYSHSGAQLGNQSLLGSSGPFGNASGSASSLIDPNLLALLGRQSREQYAEHAQQQFAPPTQQQRGRARGRAHAHHATAVEHYGAERLGSHPHAHAFGAARTGGSGTGFDRSGGGPVAGLLNSYQQAVAQSGVMQQHVNTGANAHMHGESRGAERFSRKVFVGGLPPDVDEDEIAIAFSRFGSLVVDWPHKAESKSYFPPKGYCFLLFHDEASVHALLDSCVLDGGKYYWVVSSPTVRDKPVQIRPWELADSDCVMDPTQTLDPRKTIFVGGVPRPLKASELALIMDRYYGNVCYAGIDTDPELKYPKGAGRVAFSSQQSYIAAISARFVQLQIQDIDKRVEVKPYVLDDQMCDECGGARCGGKYAPFFCGNVTCLQYYCEFCWTAIHSRSGREYHKPLVKEGADRPRAIMPPFGQRW